MLKRIVLLVLVLMICSGNALAASITSYVNGELAQGNMLVSGNKCLVEWFTEGCEELCYVEIRDETGRMIECFDGVSENVLILDRNLDSNAEYYTFEITAFDLDSPESVSYLVTDLFSVEFTGGTKLLSPGPMYVYNCQEWISMRERPNTTSERILKLPFGSLVELIQDLGNGYAQVRCTDYVGYVQTQYLTTNPDDNPVPSYSTPGPGSAEQIIPDDNFFELYPDFVPYFDDAEGIPIDFAGGPMAEYLFRGGYYFYRVANCESFVNLREEANAYSDSILQVPKGDYVTVCGDLNGWMLCCYKGRYGWIKQGYLVKA